MTAPTTGRVPTTPDERFRAEVLRACNIVKTTLHGERITPMEWQTPVAKLYASDRSIGAQSRPRVIGYATWKAIDYCNVHRAGALDPEVVGQSPEVAADLADEWFDALPDIPEPGTAPTSADVAKRAIHAEYGEPIEPRDVNAEAEERERRTAIEAAARAAAPADPLGVVIDATERASREALPVTPAIAEVEAAARQLRNAEPPLDDEVPTFHRDEVDAVGTLDDGAITEGPFVDDEPLRRAMDVTMREIDALDDAALDKGMTTRELRTQIRRVRGAQAEYNIAREVFRLAHRAHADVEALDPAAQRAACEALVAKGMSKTDAEKSRNIALEPGYIPHAKTLAGLAQTRDLAGDRLSVARQSLNTERVILLTMSEIEPDAVLTTNDYAGDDE